MATPLEQYWIDEVNRLTARRLAQRTDISAQRTALTAAQAVQLAASDAVKAQTDAVEAARKALSGIPMPADGDPLLVAMELALVGLAEAQAALATSYLTVQVGSAELARLEAEQVRLDAALAAAERSKMQEDKARAARQAMLDQLTTGGLATLAADAAAALALSEAATARARVEAEFPSSTTNAKNFLKRVRARRGIVEESLKSAAAVESAAHAAGESQRTQKQRAFDQAAAAVRSAAEAAPRLAADTATLLRLSALPAPNPPTQYPILTRWQHDRLHDATRKAARENALAKLTDVDTAFGAARAAQQTYDLALHAAMKAEPDKTQAQLDATTLSAERGALTTKLGDLTNARNAMTADELATVKSWFAAVPERLWDDLDKLDTALVRLAALVGPPAPADLITALAAAETALADALKAEGLEARKEAGADAALVHATAARVAERETAGSRVRAFAHSAALF